MPADRVIARSRLKRFNVPGSASSDSVTTLASGISWPLRARTYRLLRSDGVARSASCACAHTLYSSPSLTQVVIWREQIGHTACRGEVGQSELISVGAASHTK